LRQREREMTSRRQPWSASSHALSRVRLRSHCRLRPGGSDELWLRSAALSPSAYKCAIAGLPSLSPKKRSTEREGGGEGESDGAAAAGEAREDDDAGRRRRRRAVAAGEPQAAAGLSRGALRCANVSPSCLPPHPAHIHYPVSWTPCVSHAITGVMPSTQDRDEPGDGRLAQHLADRGHGELEKKNTRANQELVLLLTCVLSEQFTVSSPEEAEFRFATSFSKSN